MPIVEEEPAAARLAGAEPVLIEFWAPWCGPCLKFHPVVEALAERLGERVDVITVNTDECRTLPFEREVQSIPTLILFAGGEERARFAGRQPLEELVLGIERALAKRPEENA
ncbi:MAG TPA: thioredoxin domain-containing protein [Limnochordia bacterium]|nr:thioredoxin domain-containing protein [Limnochordia bacterium]